LQLIDNKTPDSLFKRKPAAMAMAIRRTIAHTRCS